MSHMTCLCHVRFQAVLVQNPKRHAVISIRGWCDRMPACKRQKWSRSHKTWRLSWSKWGCFVTLRHGSLPQSRALVNTLPVKALEAAVRHMQHTAIQHSNILSLGSHFNHSLFFATVPAGCKLCATIINPCQVREEEGKTKESVLTYEVPLMIV